LVGCNAAACPIHNEETDVTTRRFKARIKLPLGTTEVVIESDGIFNAKQMLEAQYGPGTVIWGPVEVLGNG